MHARPCCAVKGRAPLPAGSAAEGPHSTISGIEKPKSGTTSISSPQEEDCIAKLRGTRKVHQVYRTQDRQGQIHHLPQDREKRARKRFRACAAQRRAAARPMAGRGQKGGSWPLALTEKMRSLIISQALVPQADRRHLRFEYGVSCVVEPLDYSAGRPRPLRSRPSLRITIRGSQDMTKVTKALAGVQLYFCKLHHPWQKPTAKNTDGAAARVLLEGDGL